eukprot:CAMPEP_0115858460 /NCGR_PEP_ID=MMETSP0287-20121206/16110_1 /TAXON_ID=412157 /ORGANISM="Chrysochromulina rotalis, Strain UIO044" /LENGTH=95 /DNA_ID=CAMNT_0003312727 /DNA_START=1304 /DNA_END=1592 /DNA_ORIENTATION=-
MRFDLLQRACLHTCVAWHSAPAWQRVRMHGVPEAVRLSLEQMPVLWAVTAAIVAHSGRKGPVTKESGDVVLPLVVRGPFLQVRGGVHEAAITQGH